MILVAMWTALGQERGILYNGGHHIGSARSQAAPDKTPLVAIRTIIHQLAHQHLHKSRIAHNSS
jgi:hypothetical protein